ncbi:hypothetical protein F4823DRAFT_599859 [Ustulina deusta]|nr:hypothetical protein F4823DRAFT_599859 [Ustulina deusta]
MYLEDEKFRNMNEEMNVLAELVAETHINTLSSDAILTADGYANKEGLKDALVKIDTAHWNGNLEAMLTRGAYIYTALHKQEVVGVIILMRLTEEIPTAIDSPKMPLVRKVTFPDSADLEAVKEYAQSDEKDKEFMHQLRCNVNSLLGYRDAGELWELCGFGVKEKFRHQGIGRTLVKHALSQVPVGDRVIIHAEPSVEAMYQHMGFQYAMSESGTGYSITLRPEWESGRIDLVFPMMILQKKEAGVSRDS